MAVMATSTTSNLLANRYAYDVAAGKVITSKKVRLACQRHLADLKRQGTASFPYVFDEELAYRPIAFIERFCRPSQGDFHRLDLQPWQHFIIGSLYGWVHKDTKLRRFKEGLIYVGRKNGKTTMISGLSLYSASKDGERGARVFQLANSKEQARELFDECKHMIASSPTLASRFDETLHEIRYSDTMSKIMPLATDSKKLDGKNCSFGVFDEIHEYKNFKLINVIKNSTGARRQPLLLYITTAGYQLDGPLMDYYEKAADILSGSLEDERFFCFMAELDPEDELEDTSTWVKANPNLGLTIKLEDMIEEWTSRKSVPAEKNDFITKRLNLFSQSDEQSFIDFEIIKANDATIDPDELRGMNCVGGFDLSQTEDFTSACLEFPLEDGRVFILSHSFVPQRKVELDNESLPFRSWGKEGLLTICPGAYVDYKAVLDWFVEQSKLYSIDLITYDPANAYRLVEDMKSHGFMTQVVRQGALTLNPAMKDVKEMLLDGRVVFNKNKLFRWYLNNVKLVEDRNGNWLPTKQGRYRKIDGFAAWLNAHTEVMKRMVAPAASGNLEFVSISKLLGR